MKKVGFFSLVSLIAIIVAKMLFAEDSLFFNKDAFIESARNKSTIELSLKESIALSLMNNSEIKLKKIEPIIAQYNIKKAKGAFEPSLKAYFEYDETDEPGAMPTLTGTDADRSRSKDYNIGIEGKLFSNTKYDINWDNNIYSSNSRLQRFFPNYESSFGGTITQPVLKDFFGMGIDQANIIIAKNNKKISDYSFIEEVTNIITDVKSIYYDCIHYIDQRKVAELSLGSAKDLQEIITQRYEKGLVSSVELLEADAGVAKREKAFFLYERQVKKAEDDLKLLTNIVDNPDYWNASIYLTDKPVFEVRGTDLVENIKEAFVYRVDYKAAKIDLENKNINVKVAKNNLLPTVDLIGTYAANGLGDKYSSAIDQVTDNTYGSWSIGVNVKMPFGYAKEISDYKINKLEKEKAIIAFNRLEQKIILEVRDTVRNVDIAGKEVRAAEKSLKAEEKRYCAAQERFKTGLVSAHDMLEYQEDFDSTRLAYLEAMIGYNKALLNLEKTKGTILSANNIMIE